MFACHKNSYLQLEHKLNSRIINRCVQKARDVPCIDEHDLDPPFNRLVSEQPCIPIQNVDKTRLPLSFGRLDVPKLKKALLTEDNSTILAALESLLDLMHDPEKAMPAMEIKIIDTLSELISSFVDEIKEKCLQILTVLAQYRKGKEIISKNDAILNALKECMDDENTGVRLQVALLLETLASSWETADDLVDTDFIKLILHKIVREEEPIIIHMLQVLKFLTYCYGRCMCLNQFGYEILVELLDKNNKFIISGALECLMILTITKKGKNMAYKSHLVTKLRDLVFDTRAEVHTAAISVLMNCTIKAKTKIEVGSMTDVVKRLVSLAKTSHNTSIKVYSMKTLTNIAEYPKTRKLLQKEYSDDLQKIPVGEDLDLHRLKEVLIASVAWFPETCT